MNRNFNEILLNVSDIAIDNLLDNDIVREIPIVGTSVRIIQGIKSLSDKIYLARIRYFLENIGELDNQQRRILIEESRKDEKRRAKFGEAILSNIVKSDSNVKIEYLAVAFESFLHGNMSDRDLRTICYGIQNSFTDDLVDLVESSFISSDTLKNSIHSKLVISKAREYTVDLINTEFIYELSHAGYLLRRVWTSHKKEWNN